MKLYCVICILFMLYYKLDSSNEENDVRWEIKLDEVIMLEGKIKFFILEMCFIYSEENIEYFLFNVFFEEDGISFLIFCVKCCVWVYVSCYGVFFYEICDGWLCVWCKRNVWIVECCFCNLRGGVFK